MQLWSCYREITLIWYNYMFLYFLNDLCRIQYVLLIYNLYIPKSANIYATFSIFHGYIDRTASRVLLLKTGRSRLRVRLFGDVAASAAHAAIFCGEGRFSKGGKTAAWKGRYDGTAFNVRARPRTQRVVSAIRYIYKSKITILPLPPPSLLPSTSGTIAIVGIVAIVVAAVPASC